MRNLQSLLGIFALLAIAWGVSEDRHAVAWRQAGIGLLVTFATAVLMLKLPGSTHLFGAINGAVDAISAASRAGTSFVFGYLGGGQLPFELKNPGAEFVLALQALPVVLVMSVLTTLLFYEFLAYIELSKLPEGTIDARSRLIILFALCGFANFGSLGIMIAGLATMAPDRRDDVVSLGLKSIVSGTLTTCLIGAVVGLLTGSP